MMMLSRRSLSWLCLAACLLAVAGWTQAWRNARALEQAGEAGGGARRESRTATRDRSAAAATALVSDPRSQRLVKWMEEMEKSAVAGQPNPAFIQAAITTLNDSLFHRRQRDFRLLMEKMSPADAQAIHAHFKAMEREGKYFGEYAAFAMRWGQIAGEEAMAHWLETDRGHGNLVEFITGWASTEPEKALAWVKDHQADLGNSNAYRPLLVGWLSRDPVSASTWLEGAALEPAQVIDCVNGAMLDKIFSDGIEGASEWIASLPDHREDLAAAARQGWMSHMGRQGNLDPRKAATAWASVGGESWMQPQDFQQFCQTVAAGNGGSLEDFTDTLAKAWPSATISAQFERWADADAHAAAEAIAALPTSFVRDTATDAFLRRLEKTDPTTAAAWRESFGR